MNNHWESTSNIEPVLLPLGENREQLTDARILFEHDQRIDGRTSIDPATMAYIPADSVVTRGANWHESADEGWVHSLKGIVHVNGYNCAIVQTTIDDEPTTYVSLLDEGAKSGTVIGLVTKDKPFTAYPVNEQGEAVGTALFTVRANDDRLTVENDGLDEVRLGIGPRPEPKNFGIRGIMKGLRNFFTGEQPARVPRNTWDSLSGKMGWVAHPGIVASHIREQRSRQRVAELSLPLS